MTTAYDLISHLKAGDDYNVGVVTLLRQSTLYERLLAAWPGVARQLLADRHPHEQVPAELEPRYHLRWLWARIEPEPEPIWCEVSGLPDAPHVLRGMEVLRDNAVVFPDGTMSKWAKDYLAARAAQVGVSTKDVEAAFPPDDV